MMRSMMRFLFVGTMVCGSFAWAQQGDRQPHIGYLYPAGGQSGTTFEVIAGGQNLRGARGEVIISGEGIKARAVDYYRQVRNLNGEQRKELERLMREARENRLAEQSGKAPKPKPADMPVEQQAATEGDKGQEAPGKETAKKGEKDLGKLPHHPLLDRIEGMSLRELENLQYIIANTNKRQLNPQLAEMVRLDVTIEPDAQPGPREIRLETAAGITNPMRFDVSAIPEVQELEPNDPQTGSKLPKPAPLELPVLLNGQILPGDVDRYSFKGKQGQQLVIDTHARSLVPYLADAVPGWFQATVALYDDKNNEIAFADDFRFDPDPVLLYEIPKDGTYELEIRDSIFRGREDFVYRVSLSEEPFITDMFPLGGRAGDVTVASLEGWNLPAAEMALNMDYGTDTVRCASLTAGSLTSNPVTYAVDKLEECVEAEPNNSMETAQEIGLPRIVNGRINAPEDVDVFKIVGRAGDSIVAEVHGRRLRSPIDSLVRLLDANGAVLAWNDDFVDKDGHLHRIGGLLTHDADSYMRTELPADGTYYVQISDSQRQGGDAYAYRLRVSPPQPDFELRATPASLNITAGLAAPICVHALRQDGFDGEIKVILKDAPAGFVLNGGRIPKGKDSVRMTLSAPAKSLPRPVVLHLEGQAMDGHRELAHPVRPADDMMQAFLWRHLAPAEEFMVAVTGNKQGGAPVRLVEDGALKIPKGGDVEVRVKTPKAPILKSVKLELNEPPQGLSLEGLQLVPEGLAFLLKADSEAIDAGLTDNLIVEAFVERQVGKGATQTMQRVSIGVLPAIPFEIVTR